MISIIAGLVGPAISSWQARKKIKVEGQQRLAQAKVERAVKRLEADARRYERASRRDSDYDLQVLRNRDRSWSDEVLIGVFLGIFVLPFADALQATFSGERLGVAEAVGAGWQAHGYEGAPWWFEFALVGILVSTLGLFRLFRLWKGFPEPAGSQTGGVSEAKRGGGP